MKGSRYQSGFPVKKCGLVCFGVCCPLRKEIQGKSRKEREMVTIRDAAKQESVMQKAKEQQKRQGLQKRAVSKSRSLCAISPLVKCTNCICRSLWLSSVSMELWGSFAIWA